MAAIEPIEKALEIAGIYINFDNFNILAFPGFSVAVLYKNEVSVYEVEKQIFTFEVSTKSVRENSIDSGMKFYMTDDVYKYCFEIDRRPENDITGWSRLHCNYISKEYA